MDKPRSQLVANIAENQQFKLIGLGGVGGIVARYLSMFLAAQPKALRMLLIDGDAFEPSNATRMFFSGFGNKAAVLCDELLSRFGDSQLALAAIEQFVTPQNIANLIREGDIVVLAVDNHSTRKLAADHCGGLSDICLISAGNDGVGADSTGRQLCGTYGNCQIQVRRGGRDVTPSLLRYHPEIANPADKLPTDQSCTELLQSVPQILFTNLMAASVCLNTLWLYLCGELDYPEVCFDIAAARMAPLPLPSPRPS